MLYLKNQFSVFLLVIGVVIATSCENESVTSNTEFGIFSNLNESTMEINGVIDSDTPIHWENYISSYPNTKMMFMRDCPGSDDDDANLEVARKMRTYGLEIHLPSDASIASGATDMFLAGIKRTRESGSQIGVHSWSDGSNEATSFPIGHENHLPYINYYVEMGFSQKEAEDFYYFTINAASAADIHWMTDEEIERYKLLTE